MMPAVILFTKNNNTDKINYPIMIYPLSKADNVFNGFIDFVGDTIRKLGLSAPKIMLYICM